MPTIRGRPPAPETGDDSPDPYAPGLMGPREAKGSAAGVWCDPSGAAGARNPGRRGRLPVARGRGCGCRGICGSSPEGPQGAPDQGRWARPVPGPGALDGEGVRCAAPYACAWRRSRRPVVILESPMRRPPDEPPGARPAGARADQMLRAPSAQPMPPNTRGSGEVGFQRSSGGVPESAEARSRVWRRWAAERAHRVSIVAIAATCSLPARFSFTTTSITIAATTPAAVTRAP